jgi:hypothetical protein
MEARMCWEFYHGLADISILSRAMIHFDSDMSKSTNTVVYFDWKTVIVHSSKDATTVTPMVVAPVVKG